VAADRELPVVWAVMVGSLRNKAILVPAALAISAFIPWAVTPLLMIGGAFLCYEGFEKIAHKYLHSAQEDEVHHAELVKAVANPAVDLVAFERERISGAVRTDFILSAEIIAITLGTVAGKTFSTQVGVLVGIALLMTFGVYGLVAAIVKLDDAGLWLSRRASAAQQALGRGILVAAPYLMKTLSVLGTAAMFLVGGGILTHGVHGIDSWIKTSAHASGALPAIGGLAEALVPMVLNGIIGVVAGAIVVAAVMGVKKLRA
jgi:predicted DNA repair protein MutK